MSTKMTQSILPSPPLETAKEVWADIFQSAHERGFILVPLVVGGIGESKQDKLAQDLLRLADQENETYTQAGRPALPSLAPREHVRFFTRVSFLPFIHPDDPLR